MSNPAGIHYILGIQSFANHEPGAALVRYSDDGAILDFVAISEERLSRKKYSYEFPVLALGYCLDHYGLERLDQVDWLVTDHIRIKRWFHSGPSFNPLPFDYLKLKLDFDPRRIHVIGHHEAHAAATYYFSGFDDAAILISDGNGSEMETTSYYTAEGDTLRFLDNARFRGIGICYRAVTTRILNLGFGGDGKTMGLAPFGASHPPVLTKLRARLDGPRADLSEFMRRLPWSDVLVQRMGLAFQPFREVIPPCPDPGEVLNPFYSRIAYELQAETERIMVHLANDLYQRTGKKRLCMAGGVTLNSVANKLVLDHSPFEELFVFPAASDTGIPFGLAIWGYYNLPGLGDFPRRRLRQRHVYTGVSYGEERIRAALERHGLPYRRVTVDEVAGWLAEGRIVGWFQGGSEYGPRALGHRSILTDSRREEMKAILNQRVKHREGFRPFAPAILREHARDYFDLEGESPYMLLVADALRESEVPAVTHVDHTARVQTLTAEDNGVFHDLVASFHRLTGTPCLLNTSFNDAGEPIVETPEDAILCFLRTEMDDLVLGDYALRAGEIVDREGVARVMAEERAATIGARHQELLRRHFPGCDGEEMGRYLEEQARMAVWHALYRSKYELEKQVVAWVERGTRLVVVGTPDHTRLLSCYINDFFRVRVVAFVPYGDRVDGDGVVDRDSGYPAHPWGEVGALDFDEVLISSYEYQYEIADDWAGTGIAKPVYAIYDSSSRSFFQAFREWPVFPVRGCS